MRVRACVVDGAYCLEHLAIVNGEDSGQEPRGQVQEQRDESEFGVSRELSAIPLCRGQTIHNFQDHTQGKLSQKSPCMEKDLGIEAREGD